MHIYLTFAAGIGNIIIVATQRITDPIWSNLVTEKCNPDQRNRGCPDYPSLHDARSHVNVV